MRMQKMKNDLLAFRNTQSKQVKILEFWVLFGPRREKTCFQGFPQSEFQTGLL